MAKDRRTLIEGLKNDPEPPVDLKVELDFIHQDKKPAPAAEPKAAARLPAGSSNPGNSAALVALTARIPAEKFQALKRASFERQLQGVKPSSIQEIVEEALTPWLRKHGYLS